MKLDAPRPRPEEPDYPFQGSLVYQGVTIDIENRKGSVRSGVSDDGVKWSTKMPAHYGEVRGTIASDGDALDVYIGDDAFAPYVYVIQAKFPRSKAYDETKSMLGFANRSEAVRTFRAAYNIPGFYLGCVRWSIGAWKKALTKPKVLVGPMRKPLVKGQLGLFGPKAVVKAHIRKTKSGVFVVKQHTRATQAKAETDGWEHGDRVATDNGDGAILRFRVNQKGITSALVKHDAGGQNWTPVGALDDAEHGHAPVVARVKPPEQRALPTKAPASSSADPSTDPMPSTPKVLELFAGAGGMAFGLNLAGFQTEALVEYEKHQTATLRTMVDRGAIHGEVIQADIREMDFSRWRGRVDVLTGGPPCQPFSKASMSPQGSADPRDGWPHMMRAVDQVRPKYVIAENVGAMLGHKYQPTRDLIEGELKRMGYHWKWEKVHADKVGIAQARQRVILTAWRQGYQPEPREIDTSAERVSVGDMQQPFRSEDLDAPVPSAMRPQWLKKHPPLDPTSSKVSPTVIANHKSGGVHLVDVPDVQVGTQVQLIPRDEYVGPPQTGQVIRDLGDHVFVETPTGLARWSKDRVIAPRGVKRASAEMRADWQSFPRQWDFQGGKTATDRQIGNAVPPMLAFELGRTIHPDPPKRLNLTPSEYYAHHVEKDLEGHLWETDTYHRARMRGDVRDLVKGGHVKQHMRRTKSGVSVVHEHERVMRKQVNPGATWTVPRGDITVESVKDGTATLTRDGGAKFRMPVNSVPHHIHDMRGDLHHPATAKHDSINKVLSGGAKLLGKGNDGLVFHHPDDSGNVVKVSTTTPYQPENPGHRTPQEAVDHLRNEHTAHKALEGNPLVQDVHGEEHHGRFWMVKPHLDTNAKLSKKEVDHVAKHVRGMREKGWTVNDQIQVGKNAKGHVKIMDLGQAVKETDDHSISLDEGHLSELYRQHGHRMIPKVRGQGDPGPKLLQAERQLRTQVKAAASSGDHAKARSLIAQWKPHATEIATEMLSGKPGQSDDDALDAYMAYQDGIDGIEALGKMKKGGFLQRLVVLAKAMPSRLTSINSATRARAAVGGRSRPGRTMPGRSRPGLQLVASKKNPNIKRWVKTGQDEKAAPRQAKAQDDPKKGGQRAVVRAGATSVQFRHPETGEARQGTSHGSGEKGITVVDHQTGQVHKVEHGHYAHPKSSHQAAQGDQGQTEEYQPPKRKGATNVDPRTLAIAKHMFGREVTGEHLAAMGGVPPDVDVNISSMAGAISIEADWEHGDMGRQITRGPDGPVIENLFFELKEGSKGKSIGTKALLQQVQAAGAMGAASINTEAARSDDLVGYYVWPRLGYDGDLPPEAQKATGGKRLSDIMGDQKGRDWWKANGDTISVSFDPKPGSMSRGILEEYAKTKGLEAMAKAVDAAMGAKDAKKPAPGKRLTNAKLVARYDLHQKQLKGADESNEAAKPEEGKRRKGDRAEELSSEDESALDEAWSKHKHKGESSMPEEHSKRAAELEAKFAQHDADHTARDESHAREPESLEKAKQTHAQLTEAGQTSMFGRSKVTSKMRMVVQVKPHMARSKTGKTHTVRAHARVVKKKVEPTVIPKTAKSDTTVIPDVKHYKVLDRNWAKFEAAIEKLKKRATKIGITPPEIIVHSTGTQKMVQTVVDPMIPGGVRYKELQVPYREVEVFGPRIEIGGWNLRAKIEPLPGGKANTVTALGEEDELPHQLWHTGSHCDHCDTTRNRKNIFALQSDGGKWMQVGTSCLADFAGMDPADAAKAAQWLGIDWSKDLDEGDWEEFGQGKSEFGGPAADMTTVLKVASYVMDQDGGFVSSQRSGDESRPSTSEQVKEILFGFEKPKNMDAAKHEARAEATLEWLKGLDPDKADNFQRNLYALAHSEYVPDKKIGLAAAAHVAHDRAMADDEKRAGLDPNYGDKWFGEEGDRIGTKKNPDHPVQRVTFERQWNFDTQYGAVYYGAFKADDGTVFKVKLQGTNYPVAGTDGPYMPYTRGEVFDLGGTVKRHEERYDNYREKDVKQTAIIRAKLQRVMSEKEQAVYDTAYTAELEATRTARKDPTYEPASRHAGRHIEATAWEAVQAALV